MTPDRESKISPTISIPSWYPDTVAESAKQYFGKLLGEKFAERIDSLSAGIVLASAASVANALAKTCPDENDPSSAMG